jgi:LysR family transcriptional regulator, transcriptional activator of nhaA
MEWLNYHHLHYFWMVAKEGSIARACEKLRLAQPTISGQLRQFEESLGEKLFAKSGRNLVLTDTGQVVYRYAEEIFSVGTELQDVLRGRPQGRPARFLVGISDLMPKWIVFRFLEPVLKMPQPVHLICYEDNTDGLLLKLASHTLDMILTDAPVTASSRTRAFNHELGSCGVSFCAAPALAARYRKRFPESFNGAPFLVPTEGSVMRRSLEQWFERHGIRPAIVGEFQDSALLKVFGQAGAGIFPVASAAERDVRKNYGAAVVGRTSEITERFYAISVERRLKHPAVVALSEAARQFLLEAPSTAAR